MSSDDKETGGAPASSEGRLRTLESGFSFARGMGAIIGAILSLSLGAIGAGGLATRDASLANTARVTALETRVSAVETTQSHRDDAALAARDQLAEVRSDLRAMRVSLDDITRRLQRQEDERASSPTTRH